MLIFSSLLEGIIIYPVTRQQSDILSYKRTSTQHSGDFTLLHNKTNSPGGLDITRNCLLTARLYVHWLSVRQARRTDIKRFSDRLSVAMVMCALIVYTMGE